MSTEPEAADLGSSENSPEWQRAFAWVEELMGGKLVRKERQLRWRPAWFLDLERDGEIIPLYWKGDREHREGIHGFYTLEYEATLFKVLEANGVLVPHVYGVCPDPKGMIMDRAPGRHNLLTAESDAERESVMDHFIEILAQIHSIDAQEFVKEGIHCPTKPKDIALGDFPFFEKQYRAAKRRPEPMIEFVVQWVYRNTPTNRTRAAFVTSDAGQFLFDKGRVTAILDLEIGYLGDPITDFGGLLCRHLGEPLGDMRRAIQRYGEHTGEPVDLDLVRWHTVKFDICTPLAMAHFVAGGQPGIDIAMYQAWQIVWGRGALDAMADLIGGEDPTLEPPKERETLRSPLYDGLLALLDGLQKDLTESKELSYRVDQAQRLAGALQRADRVGPGYDEIEFDEIERLTGRRFQRMPEADAELERQVLAAGPERDVEFLNYFRRRILREHEAFRPALFDYEDAVNPPIE